MTDDHGDDPVRQMAIAAAHAFDNLLAVILGHAEILLTRLPDGDPHHADVEAIVTAARRAVGINARLRAVSRGDLLAGDPYDLGDPLLRMTLDALDRSLAMDHDAPLHR